MTHLASSHLRDLTGVRRPYKGHKTCAIYRSCRSHGSKVDISSLQEADKAATAWSGLGCTCTSSDNLPWYHDMVVIYDSRTHLAASAAGEP